ncbi:MAG TPA: chloride channel protein, partial [Ktedonobacter sp.]|nr:chloride channel protein [Ktedonobacter sp.]
GQKCVLGVLSAANIVRLYRETTAKHSRRMRGLVDGTVMLETKIAAQSPLARVRLHEAQLPPECLVVSIRREGELLFPRDDLVIQPGDTVTFLISPRGEEQLQRYLAERAIPDDKKVALPTSTS